MGLYENRHLNRSSHQPSRRTRSDGSWLLAMETGFRLLCRSMVHALFALYAHGSFRAVMPDQGFGSLELMYSHRFEPMRRVRKRQQPHLWTGNSSERMYSCLKVLCPGWRLLSFRRTEPFGPTPDLSRICSRSR